jgi:hypothetical protein
MAVPQDATKESAAVKESRYRRLPPVRRPATSSSSGDGKAKPPNPRCPVRATVRVGGFRYLTCCNYRGIAGAGNGIRTRDFNLGKVALYH